jgi:putative ABC transport system substrate-binding protein
MTGRFLPPSWLFMLVLLRHPFCALLIILWLWWGPIETSHGLADTHAAVLYPKVNEPYRSIFQSILKGIESYLGPATKSLPLAEDSDPAQVKAWLEEEKIDTIIALGKTGFLAAKIASGNLPVIVGALQMSPGGNPGISIDPDPSLLFSQLKKFVPKANGIHVVYTENSGWLIKLAETAARAGGLRLYAHPVGDLREAAHTYRELLATLRGPEQAIWLPLDNVTANEDVILPMLLQAAWERNLVVFSSKPSHAQRGALFSLFPDHFAMGKSLGKMASLAKRSSLSPEVLPLTDLQVAVNLRTAAHLGLYFSARQQEEFGLVFPSR